MYVERESHRSHRNCRRLRRRRRRRRLYIFIYSHKHTHTRTHFDIYLRLRVCMRCYSYICTYIYGNVGITTMITENGGWQDRGTRHAIRE